MENQIEKAESVKTKRFTVKENGQEVLATSKKTEADKKIKSLQKEFKPLIILLDHQDKKSTRYSKTINQQNYRIEAGNFEVDSIIKPIPEVPATKE
jgi:hypothetical protein